MLPYQYDTHKLENLLRELFEDDDSGLDEVVVLRRPIGPESYYSCCTVSYGSIAS